MRKILSAIVAVTLAKATGAKAVDGAATSTKKAADDSAATVKGTIKHGPGGARGRPARPSHPLRRATVDERAILAYWAGLRGCPGPVEPVCLVTPHAESARVGCPLGSVHCPYPGLLGAA